MAKALNDDIIFTNAATIHRLFKLLEKLKLALPAAKGKHRDRLVVLIARGEERMAELRKSLH